LTTNISWVTGGGLPCLSSALRCQYCNNTSNPSKLNYAFYDKFNTNITKVISVRHSVRKIIIPIGMTLSSPVYQILNSTHPFQKYGESKNFEIWSYETFHPT